MSYKKIVFCTLRNNRGATGGPGGVLFLQKELIGKKLLQYNCKYWFNHYDAKGKVYEILNRLYFLIKVLFTWNTYFVTHDVKSAYILARLHKKYSLIFHHQGPLIEEYINLGMFVNDKVKENLSRWERVGFTNAVSVHFPSHGAADMYFKSKYASCRRDEVNVGEPLFNVILPQPVKDPADFGFKEEKEVLTFFSLGTLTLAKGQDQVVDFMAKFLQYYKKPVRYIIVGKGPLKNEIKASLMNLQNEYDNFSYQIIDSMPHDSVMYLHKISDVYIMIHRISIFDFATLEAMSQGSAIVLSRVGGNTDFNKEDNILFTDDALENMEKFARTDFEIMKEKNLLVYNSYFSPKAFKQQYVDFAMNMNNR